MSLHTIGFRTDAIHLPIDFHTTATGDISSISYATETERDSTDAIKYLSLLPTWKDMSQNLIGGKKTSFVACVDCVRERERRPDGIHKTMHQKASGLFDRVT